MRQTSNVAGPQRALEDVLCRFGSVEKDKLMINRILWPRGGALGILFVFTLGLSHQLLAQEVGQSPPPATPQTQTATPQTQTKSANDPGAVEGQPAPSPQTPQNDRIFWTLPNYLTVEKASSLPPLTTGQKFKLVAEGTFDPVELAFIGVEASVNQADNTNPTYGQGLIGYSKRYGTAFADNAIGNFGSGAVFPALLRQDPRYYQMGKGKFLHRAAYAAVRVLITRSDSGKTQFNFSELLGNGLAAAISNAYHPGPRTLGSNLKVLGTQIGWDSVAYELKEFWPDIHRHLQRGHHNNM